MSDYTDDLQRVVEARRLDSILYIRCYCESGQCPVREFTIKVKDYDDMLLPFRRPLCPLCGSHDTSVHWAHTLDQHERYEESAARKSVNLQLWRRAHPGDTMFPASAWDTDSLPQEGTP